jgi:glycosyltransferase involved in cell wall biosynthesis
MHSSEGLLWTPLVSVLILTYNHENYIRDCINSVRTDSYKHVEIICVDNGSTDGTHSVLESMVAEGVPNLQVIRNEVGRSIPAACNQLIEAGQGDLFILFSGDDLFANNRIQRQVGHFCACPDLQIVYANGRYMGGSFDGQTVHDADVIAAAFAQEPQDMLRFIFKNRGLLIQTVMVRRSFIKPLRYDEQVIADDWIMNIRIFGKLTQRNQYAFFDEEVFLYRRHDSNVGHNFPRQSASMVEAIEKFYHFPDRRQELGDIYWLQVRAGFATYKLQYVRLVTHYFLKSMQYDFKVGRIVQYFRLLCIADMRSYRMLRPAFVFLRGLWRGLKKSRIQT